MKYLALPVLSFALIHPVPAMAEESIRLTVAATVPPRPCEYPERCDSPASKAAPAASRVIVNQEKVSYVGSPPTVEKKDDLLVVKF